MYAVVLYGLSKGIKKKTRNYSLKNVKMNPALTNGTLP